MISEKGFFGNDDGNPSPEDVDKIGAELDTPKHILQRHPFPGPGLGIRVMGEITRDKINILQKAD